jgi:hypothetical protein
VPTIRDYFPKGQSGIMSDVRCRPQRQCPSSFVLQLSLRAARRRKLDGATIRQLPRDDSRSLQRSDYADGWVRGDFMETVSLKCGGAVVDTVCALESFFWQDADEFILWLGARFTHRIIRSSAVSLKLNWKLSRSSGQKRGQMKNHGRSSRCFELSDPLCVTICSRQMNLYA